MVRQTSGGRQRVCPKPAPVETRASQLPKRKDTGIAAAAQIKRGQYKKLPGTRVQALRGGKVVRVVIEDGKHFEPGNVRAAKRYMEELRRKAEDIARVQAGGEIALAREAGPKQPAAVGAATPSEGGTVLPRRSLRKRPASVSAELTPEALEQQRQANAKRWALRAEKDGRKLVSEQWYGGTVVQREQGYAWVRLGDLAGIPEPVVQRLHEIDLTGAPPSDSNGDRMIRVKFADVAQEGLRLEAGVSLRFRLYTDRVGVGGCEAAPP